jgi:hypothetical protein
MTEVQAADPVARDQNEEHKQLHQSSARVLAPRMGAAAALRCWLCYLLRQLR